ncbi:hypothetical protein [Chelatococcus sambhunathii]|uniref:hypothetical protein n=1 Tax=Chelatococcus sambhunathii TaxID=363953 RepID=UPI0028526F84|nr:hypothetical protein [Chelatococcus sambhunathii]
MRAWLTELEGRFARRILPFDIAAAPIAGMLKDRALARGHDPDFADVQIAAIAAARDFVVLTRNLRHFEPFGVPYRDPFAGAAPV